MDKIFEDVDGKIPNIKGLVSTALPDTKKIRNKIPVASDFAKKTDYHAKILRENMLLILIAINLRVT